jgi:hypothetical protein
VLFTFEPKTYQDVKKNLTWWAAIVIGAAAIVIYTVLLPEDHRTALEGLIEGLPAWVPGLVSIAGAILAFAIIMVGILALHDRFYDRSIIRWREAYDIDFVLPHLLRPLGTHVHPRFWEVARVQRKKIMRTVFYPLVADRDGVIGENKLVRFYETATMYWMTQILEMALVLVAVTVVIYALIGATPALSLLVVLVGVQALFVLNRWFRRQAVAAMRDATIEEIEEIHQQHAAALEERVRAAHEYLELPYGRDATLP